MCSLTIECVLLLHGDGHMCRIENVCSVVLLFFAFQLVTHCMAMAKCVAKCVVGLHRMCSHTIECVLIL